jgi:hypothetical protein
MSVEVRKPSLLESMALGGMAASFAVNFTHPIETVKVSAPLENPSPLQTALTYSVVGVMLYRPECKSVELPSEKLPVLS